MAKIVIRLKSGFELPIECENAKLTMDITGNIASFKIEGAKDNRPLYLNPQDIECVYQIMEKTEEEE